MYYHIISLSYSRKIAFQQAHEKLTNFVPSQMKTLRIPKQI